LNTATVQPHRLATAGLLAMAAAMGIGRFIYTPILPPMVDALGLSKGEAGLIASANFLGYLIGALAAGSPRLPGGPRSWLLFSLAASALTTGAMGLTDSLTLFLLLRFSGGAASAFALVFSSHLVLEGLSAGRRSDLSAVHFAGVGIGIAASAAIAWAIAAMGGGWRSMWYGGAVFSIATVLVVAALVPARPDDRAPEVPVRRAPAKPRIRPLVVAYGLFGFGYIITATFIVAIVRGSAEIRSFEPFVWLVVGLAAVPSVALWAMLGRRWGNLRAFGLACLVEAVGVTSSVVWVSIPGMLVSAVFLGGTFVAITALGLMAVRELSTEAPRRALATMTAAFGLGQIIGPMVAGYGFDLTGSFLAPSLLAAFCLCISMVLAMVMVRGQERAA
jgi:predicted MFS family arabinose efflux permease